MESFEPTELDLALVNALQVRPRIAWTELAGVIGASPMTIARRWERLRGLGLAWVSATPIVNFVTAGSIAYVWVNCEASGQVELAKELSRTPAVASVELIAGQHDMLLTVAMPQLNSFATFLSETINRTKGVRSSEALIATKGYTEGGRWRLDALTRSQTAAVAAGHDVNALSNRPLNSHDREIIASLEVDGRMSHSEVATRVGLSAATTRRRINRLLQSGAVGLRCDLAAPAFGWPITAYFWARVAPADLDVVAAGVAAVSNIRLVVAVTGSANLMIVMWLRSVGEVPLAEARLSAHFPSLSFVDRTVSLRSFKRAGRLIDEHGRESGVVPMAY